MSQPLFAPKRKRFPNPRQAMDDGLLCFSDEMSVDILLEAYSFGIFPWPQDESPILWFSPHPRGILDFADYHISKSFHKFLRKTDWQVTFNQCFSQVITECAQVPRTGEAGTWITEHMMNNYKKFHQAGYAHSVEVWEGKCLVGGLYGVYVGGVFAGESMFFKKSNASKVALHFLVERLKAHGQQWMDTQMVTPNVKAIGGKYISRDLFLRKLEQAKQMARPLDL